MPTKISVPVLSHWNLHSGLTQCFWTGSLPTNFSLHYVVELVRNLVAHGDAREGKWRGNWRMEWVANTLTPPPNVVYPALLKLMRTPRLPAVDWTDAPANLNGLVRFGERRNLVSGRVPSRSARAIQTRLAADVRTGVWWAMSLYCYCHSVKVPVEHYDLCNTASKSIISINQPQGEISNNINYSICPCIRRGADKSLARPTALCRRTE